MTVELKGIVMPNDQVAGFIARHGSPTHSKPHGADKNVLYYPDTEATKKAAAAVKTEDFAGRETPATRTMVIQGTNPSGGSVVSRRVLRAGAKPNTAPIEGNPNRMVADAKILNEGALDDEVLDIEDEYKEALTSTDPKELGRPALSLGEKVSKVKQEPVKGELPEPPKRKESSPKKATKRAAKKTAKRGKRR